MKCILVSTGIRGKINERSCCFGISTGLLFSSIFPCSVMIKTILIQRRHLGSGPLRQFLPFVCLSLAFRLAGELFQTNLESLCRGHVGSGPLKQFLPFVCLSFGRRAFPNKFGKLLPGPCGQWPPGAIFAFR